MSVLRDPAMGLDCNETPFRPSSVVSRDEVAKCNSCTLVFSAPTSGPKNMYVGSKNGITIDESPLAQLIYNSQTFSLFQTFLWPQGLHRDFKAPQNYDMEMNLYFRDIFKPDNIVGVVIPVTISDSLGKNYFNEWSVGANKNIENTLESIITTDKPVLMYKGMDLRNRDSYNTATVSQCKSKDSSMIWFVLPTTYIKSTPAQQIRSFFNSNKFSQPKDKKTPAENTPPVSAKELTLNRIFQMCMIIPNIDTKTNVDRLGTAKNKANNGVFLTRALQCQRIDPNTDVKGDAVYLSGAPDSTLQEELDKASDLDKPLEADEKSTLRAKSIENMLGLILGIILGIIIFVVAAYYLIKLTYTKYEENLTIQQARIASTMKSITANGFAGLNPFAQKCPSGNPT